MQATDVPARRIRRALVNVLPKGLRVDVDAHSGFAPAYWVTIGAEQGIHHFVVGWAGEGWPSDVQHVRHLVPDVDVVAAAKLSRGARRWLSDESVSWIDETGNADISLPSGLVVVREGRKVPSSPDRSTRWTRSMLAVAEAALSDTPPTVEAIEEITALSRSAVTVALERLERIGLLERPIAQRGPRSGRCIVDRNQFLDAYADAANELRSKQRSVLVHRLWSDPLVALRAEIAPALNNEKRRWAITGGAASALLAPYLTEFMTIEMYVDAESLADEQHLATLLGGRIVERGHRIDVRELPTAVCANGPVIDDIHIALPVRVYADLNAGEGRSSEAAEHLRETFAARRTP